ncbi:MAG: ArnT family glycosyltransferase [Burkholderiales bacterium]
MTTLRSRAGFAYIVLLVLAVSTYFYGLDSAHIPKNGDEYVYQHITRLTAQSGHWLPLVSELDQMRNTKPPLLFWQGIRSSDHGGAWTLWNLRWPSVVYSLLTALTAFLLARRLSGRWQTGAIAALAFLGFFATYRYGRPFLTNPPEVFWLFLSFFVIAHFGRRATASRVLVPVLLGISIGIGLLYKSYALLMPVGLGLAWSYFHLREYRLGAFIRDDVLKLVLLGALSLAVFALWFALDPDPVAIWREFVVGENVGKLDSKDGNYFAKLFWGSSSAGSLALGYPQNAGLLALPLFGLAVTAWRRRHHMSEGEALLWIWIVTFFVVFCLPSQRSSRYLLAAMPALAVLLALNWERIGQWWFTVTVSLAAIILVLIAVLGLALQKVLGQDLYGVVFWLIVVTGLAVAVIALVRPAALRAGCLGLAFITLIAFTALTRPLDGPLGQYDDIALRVVGTRVVGVPYDFNAKYERYRFLLPEADIRGYRTDANLTDTELRRKFPLYTIQLPLDALPCQGCRVLAQRIDLRTRDVKFDRDALSPRGFIAAMVVREFLIESP